MTRFPLWVFVALAVLAVAWGILQGMPKVHSANDDAAIRQWLDRWQKAFHDKDLNAIMSLYAPGNELVAFDIVPPLQYVGADAYQKDYADFLAQYDGPIDTEIRDLHIVMGDDVAFMYCLERVSGTLKNGQKSDLWARATSGFRKINDRWLDVHDHISVPADFDTGKALLDLKP
jgi:ketosteroid isomerase-like protein